MMLRPDQPDLPDQGASPCGQPRLNLLLSDGGWREGSVVDQLPTLLEPMGIRSIRVASGEEAAAVIGAMPVHIAMVDLEIPLRRGAGTPEAGGARTLQLLRRLDQPPVVVVVRPPQPEARLAVRALQEALREGAFAVLDRPLRLDTTLEVLRRILRRYYAGGWPT
jgi:CheY-like chemotaxis protein